MKPRTKESFNHRINMRALLIQIELNNTTGIVSESIKAMTSIFINQHIYQIN